jgi:transcriptional regulator with XRE-family HTH domain
MVVPLKSFDPVDALIGERLRTWRRAKGLSRALVAQKVGVTPADIREYEWGTKRIGSAHMFRISSALGLSDVSSLFAATWKVGNSRSKGLTG